MTATHREATLPFHLRVATALAHLPNHMIWTTLPIALTMLDMKVSTLRLDVACLPCI